MQCYLAAVYRLSYIIIPLVRKNGDLYVKKISDDFFGINGSFSRA